MEKSTDSIRNERQRRKYVAGVITPIRRSFRNLVVKQIEMAYFVRMRHVEPQEIQEMTEIIGAVLDQAHEIMTDSEGSMEIDTKGYTPAKDVRLILKPIRQTMEVFKVSIKDTVIMIQRGHLPREVLIDLSQVIKTILQMSSDLRCWRFVSHEAVEGETLAQDLCLRGVQVTNILRRSIKELEDHEEEVTDLLLEGRLERGELIEMNATICELLNLADELHPDDESTAATQGTEVTTLFTAEEVSQIMTPIRYSMRRLNRSQRVAARLIQNGTLPRDVLEIMKEELGKILEDTRIGCDCRLVCRCGTDGSESEYGSESGFPPASAALVLTPSNPTPSFANLAITNASNDTAEESHQSAQELAVLTIRPLPDSTIYVRCGDKGHRMIPCVQLAPEKMRELLRPRPEVSAGKYNTPRSAEVPAMPRFNMGVPRSHGPGTRTNLQARMSWPGAMNAGGMGPRRHHTRRVLRGRRHGVRSHGDGHPRGLMSARSALGL